MSKCQNGLYVETIENHKKYKIGFYSDPCLVDASKGEPNFKYSDDKTQVSLYYPCKTQGCTPYELDLNAGIYRIELYGASGGYHNDSMGGHGAYTSGYIILKNLSKFYFYLGGKGSPNGPETFNGGGKGTKSTSPNGREFLSGSGGGSTDMRITDGNWKSLESLKSRIMVAAGGSGGQYHYNDFAGVPGGTLKGFEGFRQGNNPEYELIKSTAPTQTSPGKGAISTQYSNAYGTDGSFGYGGYQIQGFWGAGAGSGYYGGGGGSYVEGVTVTGSSGSSFISGHYGCNAIAEDYSLENMNHTNQPIHYSGIFFKRTVMKSGNESFRSAFDINETVIGHVGPGVVRISIVPLVFPYECSCVQNYSFLNYIKSFAILVMIIMES